MQNAAQAPQTAIQPDRGDATATGQALASRLTVPELARLAGEHALGSSEYTTEELAAAARAVRGAADGLLSQLMRIALSRGGGA